MARDPHIDKLIQDLKAKKFREGEGKKLTDSFGENLKTQFGPAIKDAIKEGLSSITMPKMPDMPAMPETQMPEIPAPVVNVPAPIVNVPAPIVNVPAPVINIPENKYPEPLPFPTSFKLDGVDKMRPMPVMMVDDKGKPAQLNFGGGSSGPGFPVRVLDESANALRVTGNFSVTSSDSSTQAIDSSGNPYSQANPLPVVFSSTGSTASALIDSSGVQYSGSNPLPVTVTSGAVATTAVVGDSPSGTTDPDMSQPVKVGGKYNSTTPTFTDGQRADMQISSRGSVRVELTGAGSAQAIVNLADNSDAVAVSSTGNKLGVQSRTTIYDSIGDTWNRLVGGAGITNVGTLRTVQATDSVSSVVVNSGTITAVTGITNTIASNIVDSSGIAYSGSNPVPVVFGATTTQAVNLVDSSGVAYSGSNAVPITGSLSTVTTVTGVTNSIQTVVLDRDGNPFQPFVYNEGDAATAQRVVLANNVAYSTVINSGTITAVTSITNTVAALNVDSSGVGYSGSNPLPITVVSGALTSTLSVGDSAARSADNGGNPIKVGGIARTTNPTAYADGDRSNIGTDKLGRVLVRPIQVRDLTKTAYATLSTQAETTILAGVSSVFNDVIMLTATNASSAAWKVDIRATTGGNIVHTMNVPAGTGPVGFAPSIPFPAADVGASWTATISSGSDVSNANLFITGLFSQEI